MTKKLVEFILMGFDTTKNYTKEEIESLFEVYAELCAKRDDYFYRKLMQQVSYEARNHEDDLVRDFESVLKKYNPNGLAEFKQKKRKQDEAEIQYYIDEINNRYKNKYKKSESNQQFNNSTNKDQKTNNSGYLARLKSNLFAHNKTNNLEQEMITNM